MGTFFLKSREQMVQGLPVGKLANLEARIKALEAGGGGGGSVSVNGSPVSSPNLVDSSDIGIDVTGSDISFTILSISLDDGSKVHAPGSQGKLFFNNSDNGKPVDFMDENGTYFDSVTQALHIDGNSTFFNFKNTAGTDFNFNSSSLTALRTLSIQDKDGTIAIVGDDISEFNNDAGYINNGNGQALTRTNDTNVTLTLGGSASTALVNAASLTLGWTGQLSAARGGTGLDSSAWAQGDIPYISGTGTWNHLAKDTNTTRYLSNQGTSNNPSWNQINLANGVTGDLPFANLTQIAGLSVLGVTGTSTADVAAITGTADQVLRVNSAGNALGFGTVETAGITDDAVTYAKMQEFGANKLIANNTGSTANPTEQNYNDTGDTAISGPTFTFTGTTGPSGSTNHRVRFLQTGRHVSFWIFLNYGTAGTALTLLQVTNLFAAEGGPLPTPQVNNGMSGANVYMYPIDSKVSTGQTSITGTNQCGIRRNNANDAFDVFCGFGSINLRYMWIYGEYYTA